LLHYFSHLRESLFEEFFSFREAARPDARYDGVVVSFPSRRWLNSFRLRSLDVKPTNKEKSKSKTVVVLLRMIEDFIYHTRVRLGREKGWDETKAGSREGLGAEKGGGQKRAGSRKGGGQKRVLVPAAIPLVSNVWH
jgi:hypothetical protein